jgi:hypothetical protein
VSCSLGSYQNYQLTFGLDSCNNGSCRFGGGTFPLGDTSIQYHKTGDEVGQPYMERRAYDLIGISEAQRDAACWSSLLSVLKNKKTK